MCVNWFAQASVILETDGFDRPVMLERQQVRGTALLCHFILKAIIYQDRLGTNVGKLKNRDAVFSYSGYTTA
jgi:hypothetical protein